MPLETISLIFYLIIFVMNSSPSFDVLTKTAMNKITSKDKLDQIFALYLRSSNLFSIFLIKSFQLFSTLVNSLLA